MYVQWDAADQRHVLTVDIGAEAAQDGIHLIWLRYSVHSDVCFLVADHFAHHILIM